MNSQIEQSTFNINRRKPIISCVFNQIHYLDCPMYMLITKTVVLDLAPDNPNPTVIGQCYKYMSFLKSAFIYLTLRNCYLNVSLSHMQSAAHWGNHNPSLGPDAWVLLSNPWDLQHLHWEGLNCSEHCKYMYEYYHIIHVTIIIRCHNLLFGDIVKDDSNVSI